MKSILTLVTTLVLMPILTTSMKTDDNEHKLTGLWKNYENAEKADRPADAVSALESIKKEAKRNHYTWDYYDACQKYADTRTRTNWKLRDSLQNAFRAEILDFGEPVAVYYMRRGENPAALCNYISDNEARLRSTVNPEFWSHDWRISQYKFSPALTSLLGSDWDYVLWSLYPEELMEGNYKSYPLSAFVEYKNLPREGREKALEEYAAKYRGKAVSLMAAEDLLLARFNSMKTDSGTSSAQYLALAQDCRALMQEAASFKGAEKVIADCCDDAVGILEQLEDKSLRTTVSDSGIDICTRNLEKVKLQVSKGKETLWEKNLVNPIKSFYAEDRFHLDLPDLPDGTYNIECTEGKLSEETEWQKYTLSAAIREDRDGLGIWVADFRSGEPLAAADVELIKDEKVVKTLKAFSFDGFTALPADFVTDRQGCALRVRSGDRASRLLYADLYYNAPDLTDDPFLQHCIILTDRSAFQPGETVFFKAVLYNGKYTLRTSGSGIEVKAVLRDTRGAILEEQTLVTGEYGSAAGSFVLRRSERGGMYSISLEKGGEVLASKEVLVDDIVLPSFDLVFDAMPALMYPIDSVTVNGTVRAYSGHSLAGAGISYKVEHNGKVWASGGLETAKDRFSLTFPADQNDERRWGSSYTVTVKVTDVTGETMEFQTWVYIRPFREPQTETTYFFRDLECEGIGTRIVAGGKETWAVAELHGTDNSLLDKRLLHFSPRGKGAAETSVIFPYKDGYPETIRLDIIYFQDKEVYRHTASKRLENHTYDMPLTFERFLDTTVPGAQYTFILKTAAGAEVAAAIFDKSTERFASNGWTAVRARNYPFPSVSYDTWPGVDRGLQPYVQYHKGVRTVLMSKADSALPEPMAENAALSDSFGASEESADAGIATEVTPDIPIREDFASTLAWEPFLKAESDGTVKFTFTNSDKLSTFIVQLFSHDKYMRNGAARREMVVTIPVKISLVEPQFLYGGDSWNIRTGLSSTLDEDIAGTLSLEIMDGADYRNAKVLSSVQKSVTLPAGGSCSFDFPLTAAQTGDMGIKISFRPEDDGDGADAVFVAVPVRKPVQTLTEAHSAVLLHGMDRAALEASLRAEFVNTDGSKVPMKEISILDMIHDALPGALTLKGENAVSLSSAIYAKSLCDKLGHETDFDGGAAVSKLLDLQCGDGGFCWFKGMSSSPVVTAVVLERLHGLGIVDEQAAVKYLDKTFFSRDNERWWFCGISMAQYMHVRSLFPEIKFSEKTERSFRKEARAYLTPSGDRGLQGAVLAKARRLATLRNFLEKDGGTALARSMGISFFGARKIKKSMLADVESLSQYAQPHKSGGMYYPNAVMPWRGLLESELYANSLLCTLMDEGGHGDIADGVRLWIMIQKETQHWEDDPAYIEAISAVTEASPEVLATKVLALQASYEKPFGEIAASGNGMGISERPVADTLKVGDRIKITWDISNEENRSFVKVTLPRNAGLVPVDQTSGYSRGAYRSVLSDRTELWFESYPEEKTTVSEEYYVTRSGVFQCPAAQIECLYSTHYRANTASPGKMEIQ